MARSPRALRLPFFELKLELLAVLVLMAIIILARTASAETESSARTTKSTTTVTTTTQEIDGEDPAAVATPAATPNEEKEFIVTKIFGSKAQSGTAGCKTEELSAQHVEKLEGQCDRWVDGQKRKLKKKFQTGTCEEDCADCGTSLKRCTVTGTVHYAK